MLTSRYPVGISTEFCFRWQKKSLRWEGEGDKGGKGEKKGGKEERKKKKKENHGERENRTVVAHRSRSRVQCLTRHLL